MQDLIPFRWPAEWKDPSKLTLIKGTPINCLVGEAPPPFPIGDLKFVKLDKASSPDGVVVRAGVWPRVLPAKDADSADAGATGGAWVDSNAGWIRHAQTMQPGKAVWVTFTAPTDEVIPLERFAKPIAETAVYGARWVITLNQPFIEGLDKNSAEATAAWKRMMGAIRFFEARREWKSWEPVAVLTVVSDFQGDSELLAEEFLNMAPRRHLAHRIVRPGNLTKASFEKQKAVIFIGDGPPEGEVRKMLLAFAEAGGLLISPRGILDTKPDETRMEYEFHRHGKGRVAVPVESWIDPYLLVREVHLLMSHREDVVRIWNGGEMNSHLVASPKGDRAVLHLIPYISEKTDPLTLGFNQMHRSVRVRTLESETVVKPVKGDLGYEVPVGEITTYAAVELEV